MSDDYAHDKARAACRNCNHLPAGTCSACVAEAIKQACADQRRACAEAVAALEGGRLVPHGRIYIAQEKAVKATENAEPMVGSGEVNNVA